jgi:general secretion pathway protein H
MAHIERRAGFTLIEMMAVMMIIALMASIVLAAIPGTGRPALKALVMQTEALLRRERRAAVLQSSDRRVALDEDARSMIGDEGERVTIPPDVTINLLGEDTTWDGRRAVAVFHPDGSSSGAVVRFSRQGTAYEIRVNWYNGRVSIETP